MMNILVCIFHSIISAVFHHMCWAYWNIYNFVAISSKSRYCRGGRISYAAQLEINVFNI